MSSVSVSNTHLVGVRDLFVLYSKKGAFTIEEYADCGAVFKRLTAAVEEAQESENKNGALTDTDAKYVITAINVCSQRVPTEVANYKAIAELLEVFSDALKANAEEETKIEEA